MLYLTSSFFRHLGAISMPWHGAQFILSFPFEVGILVFSCEDFDSFTQLVDKYGKCDCCQDIFICKTKDIYLKVYLYGHKMLLQFNYNLLIDLRWAKSLHPRKLRWCRFGGGEELENTCCLAACFCHTYTSWSSLWGTLLSFPHPVVLQGRSLNQQNQLHQGTG